MRRGGRSGEREAGTDETRDFSISGMWLSLKDMRGSGEAMSLEEYELENEESQGYRAGRGKHRKTT